MQRKQEGSGSESPGGPGLSGAFLFGVCVLLLFIITLQFVREICQFDLTCPIKGVGAGVVRKLLLEESLKIRGRKDSKVG